MPTFVLTDVARDVWVERFATAADLGDAAGPAWSVAKRALRGGRRDGVDLIEVDNGSLAFAVVPTRGMGLWRGRYKGHRLGWDSPVADGPVHPAFVHLEADGGLGWLAGFDEWLVRCGLASNGAPFEEKAVAPDGSERHTIHPLHGRIANIPAHEVAVHVGEGPAREIVVEGKVTEGRLFGGRVELTARVATTAGSNRLVVRDELKNLGASPADVQLLYHWNFGPPFLEAGARLVAPFRSVAPRDPRAAEGVDRFDDYGPPVPGATEQVYFATLSGAGDDGSTCILLRDRGLGKGVALRFSTAELAAFTLWKCEGAEADGYVTGLEPATNYPNPHPFEAARGRVLRLAPGQSVAFETTVEVLDDPDSVAAVVAEIARLSTTPPVVHTRPAEPFSPA
ncbi:MAG TPA: aldose 1-epimerase family protein [Isosphaeraceae bacterium]|jgi:hypothetical protein|nr:aldose 1-epimerase family protein [Isosphaeraceae bacterium]